MVRAHMERSHDAFPPRRAEPDASREPGNAVTRGATSIPGAGPLSAADIAALLSAAEHGSVMWRRNRALVAVLGLCGLRAGESLGLDGDDVSFDRGTLTVTAEGNPRVVPVSPEALDALAAWTDERLSIADPRTEGLFVTREGARLAPGQMRQLLSRLARRAGIAKPVSAATLRRAHASELVSRGWPLHEIQQRLGYGTLAATRRFLATSGLPPALEGHAPALAIDMEDPGPCRACLYGDARESDSALGLLEEAGDAVLAVDHDGTVRAANGVAEALFPSTRPSVVGANLWDLLSEPRYARIRRACHDCATTRRPVAETAVSAFGGRRALFRAIPTTKGIVLWIRDDLTLGFMEGFLRGCLELAHGGARGTVALLRAIRDQAGESTDFVVVAAHGTRETRLLSDHNPAGRRLSHLLPPEYFTQFTGKLAHTLATGDATRLVAHASEDPSGQPLMAIRIIALGGEWLVVTARDVPTSGG